MAIQEQTTAIDADAITTILDGFAGPRTIDPLDRVFLERGIRGLVSLVLAMEPTVIRSAVSEARDLGVLLKALESKAGLKLITAEDPLAAARLRGLQMKLELLERAGGALQPSEVAGLLRMSRQAVGKRRRNGKLLAVVTGRRGFEYPACQFGDGGVVPGLAEVLAAFDDDVDSWMRLSFLVSPLGSLGGDAPLDLLRLGEIEPVVRLARSVGEHGAP
jgi:hypothetical protein